MTIWIHDMEIRKEAREKGFEDGRTEQKDISARNVAARFGVSYEEAMKIVSSTDGNMETRE